MEEEKPVKCIVLDAGPLILNEPSISSLLAKSEELYTTQAVLAEIRDASARQRVQTTVLPFLKLREPGPASVKIVSDFARRTGDLPVLSKTDLQVIALAYELECEKNGGDWRLRKVPGQKELNGSPPGKGDLEEGKAEAGEGSEVEKTQQDHTPEDVPVASLSETDAPESTTEAVSTTKDDEDNPVDKVTESIDSLKVDDDTDPREPSDQSQQDSGTQQPSETESDPSDDSDGEWITPSNLSSRRAADSAGAPSSSSAAKAPVVLQVATLTSDFALQNVLLQMNLNLLSSHLVRVRQVRSHVLRCHACFAVHREPSRQFCSRCGQPALTRVACSTRADGGGLVLHLSRKFQHNRRGDRYSIPKPVSGSASGKSKNLRGGGKNGWGAGLILTEDQKEYTRALAGRGRGGGKGGGAGAGFLDEDYLPGILTGRRDQAAGGRPKIGAGRNVNSKKR